MLQDQGRKRCERKTRKMEFVHSFPQVCFQNPDVRQAEGLGRISKFSPTSD